MNYENNWREIKISILKWQNQAKEQENNRLKDRKGRLMVDVYPTIDMILKRVLDKMEVMETH